jgi:CRP-like cAMP-binding protein
LVSGASFGELAFINEEPRAATIKCLTKCSFATLTKEEYNAFLSKIEIKE